VGYRAGQLIILREGSDHRHLGSRQMWGEGPSRLFMIASFFSKQQGGKSLAESEVGTKFSLVGRAIGKQLC
jgi:hypothetical protein